MSYRPDHHHVRALGECPICGQRKERGLLACAACWETQDDNDLLRKIDAREREIEAEHGQFGVGA